MGGPVAFALAHGAPNDTGIILTTTLMIIFITTFIIGGITLPVCTWLNLKVGPKRFNRKATWFHKIDGRILRPYFGVPRRIGWKDDTYSVPSARDSDDEPAAQESQPQPVEKVGYDMSRIEMTEKDSLAEIPEIPANSNQGGRNRNQSPS